ncbi:tyrosine-protein phosphatase [Gordonia sp. LSe1-13]|uniref:Tyrosine-protein phosphatase n=1 Tax=Gordonia sesuvii TaxID=3116777 RepID=A0ABU7M998_9ACTN|nr:tyrosine-protein phosphatase [Gordonia sp. LSe1-13]
MHRSSIPLRTARTAAAIAVAGSFLFAGTAAAAPGAFPAFGSSGFGSSAPDVVDTPRLASLDNFRDAAGGGYMNKYGVRMQTGVFYRSNAISPSDPDLAVLAGLNLTAAYDLRTDGEVADKADRLPGGVAYVRVPVDSGNLNEIAELRSPDEARRYMADANRAFVTDPAARASFGKLLTELAETPGAQIYHCTAGKDRTGWVSALLQSIAMVPEETIMRDYLLTNKYTAESIAKSYEGLTASQGEAVAEIYRPLLGVEAGYLQAGLDELSARYGTVDNYLRTGLGLSRETIVTLGHKLLA